MNTSEISIESNQDAVPYFEEFIKAHQDEPFLEEGSGMDGGKIICLIIEKAPAIITALTALITVLRAKGIPVKIKEDGEEKSVDALSKA